MSDLLRTGVAILISCATTGLIHGAELNAPTIKAWEQYVESAKLRMDERVHGRKPFLWVEETQPRRQALRANGMVVEPVGAAGRVEVPDGLIHDWIGAAFLPGETAQHVLDTLDEYDHYSDFYKPAVVSSRLIARDGNKRVFSMRWKKKTGFVVHAMDADYETWYGTAGPDRWWSEAITTRVQEIDHLGQSDQSIRPVGVGAGYVWRLCSFTKVVQLEDGVIIEIEALALSRDIPDAIAWFVNPIVSRLSRSALLTTLQQTKEAVRGDLARGSAGATHAAIASAFDKSKRIADR